MGLLEPYRRIRASLTRASRDRYHSALVRVYGSSFAVLHEPFDKLQAVERSAEIEAAERRFEADRDAVLLILSSLAGLTSGAANAEALLAAASHVNVIRALSVLASGAEDAPLEKVALVLEEARSRAPSSTAPGSDSLRAALRAILERVVDIDGSPRFFEFDQIDDIDELLESRYSTGDAASVERGRRLLRALRALMRCEAPEEYGTLPARLKAELGDFSRYVPRRGEAHAHVRSVIPDLYAEFCSLRGTANPERFLQINREYSARQHDSVGDWDSRDLSLLREYERDHHALLRSTIKLMRDGKISSRDEALILGPRHVNEMDFFRRHLRLPRTVGLDLFASDGGRILAGDMHRMPFESGRFKLVYVCNTLTYAYNARTVIREICRVASSPGYAMIVDSGTRISGPDPLGRSDLMSADALVRCFHPRPYRVIVRDRGKSLAPDWYSEQPCVLLELN